MTIEKRIAYKEGSSKPEGNSGFDPLYGAEGDNLIVFPRDRIKPWWEDEETKAPRAPEGIMSQVAKMSTKDLREFYGGYLIPYGYREEDIMKMPMDKLEYLFNTVMSI